MTSRPPTELDDRPASLGRRFLAVLVDQVVVLALGGGVVLVASVRAAAALRDEVEPAPAVPTVVLVGAACLALAVTLAQWLAHGRWGWTLGRRLLQIRTVDVHSRRPIGAGRVLVRGLVVAAGLLAFAVGQLVVLLSPLFDATGRRRGWHDRAVDAEVLRVGVATGRAAPAPTRRAAVAGAAAGRRPPVPGPAAPSPVATTPTAAVPAATGGVPPATPGGGLVLAPLHPQRSAPDLDTRAMPVVREAPTLAFGLAPELELTRPAPPRPDVVPEPRVPSSQGLRVALDDGRVLTVERLALVGRNPSPGPGVQTVRVVDPARSVSKTHLQLAVDPTGGAWVVDRGSTNGTVVTLPDGGQVVCRVDHRVRLRDGAVVVFGDRSLRVVAVPTVTSTARAGRVR